MRWIFLAHAIAALFALMWMLRVRRQRREQEERARAVLNLHSHREEPVTLHPVIDPDLCIGSGACVSACPEERALVLVDGRAHLALAAGCVGHGACAATCPVDAISLVFGSARRGVDLPELSERFETSESGLYIAGELGGMGLIATAVRQGVKAVEAMAKTLQRDEMADPTILPLLVVGAGPAGIAATLCAQKLGIRSRTIEKCDDLGGAVLSYPRGKVVMTTPADLPLYGRVHLRRTDKRALLELWQDVLSRAQQDIEYGITVDSVTREGEHLTANTSAGPIRARRVLLATGRRGRPRRLEVEGESKAHVHHLLEDPAAHAGTRCVVIGGGDSAVEAALMLAEHANTSVVLCHRNAEFSRIKPDNHDRLVAAEAQQLRVLRSTSIELIEGDAVVVKTPSGSERIPAEHVFVLIGADLPLDLLSASGILVKTYRGESATAPA